MAASVLVRGAILRVAYFGCLVDWVGFCKMGGVGDET